MLLEEDEHSRCVAGVPPASLAEGLLAFDGSWPGLAPTLPLGQMDSDLLVDDLNPAPAVPDAGAPWLLPETAATAARHDARFALAPEPAHARHDDPAVGGWVAQPLESWSSAAPGPAHRVAPPWDEYRCATRP